jgi:hypothetical protein
MVRWDGCHARLSGSFRAGVYTLGDDDVLELDVCVDAREVVPVRCAEIRNAVPFPLCRLLLLLLLLLIAAERGGGGWGVWVQLHVCCEPNRMGRWWSGSEDEDGK